MNAGQWNKEIFYVDKSLIVKKFLSLKHRIQLVSVPQGFLKTSNLRLLASFFDINTDSKVEMKRRRVFENTKIMKRADIVAEYFGKYPTIFITFEHQESYNVRRMIEVFRELYSHNDFLLDSSRLTFDEKRKFQAYLDYQAPTLGYNQMQLADAVSFLCELLHKHYEKKVFVFVDNYDSPFLNAISNNRPMCNFLPFLERLLTNIGTCGSLNRLLMSGTTSISSLGTTMKITEFKFLKKNKYVKYFGFTERDLQELAVRCSAEVMEDLKKGCYLIMDDNMRVYSPEWVLSQLNYAPIENPYWYENILKKQIYHHLPALKMKIRLLVRGEDVIFGINKYKTAKDLWLINKLLNGSMDGVNLEVSDINLLFSLFLEFGLFTYRPTLRRRRSTSLSWSCLMEQDPIAKLVINHTSRGSEILKTEFSL